MVDRASGFEDRRRRRASGVAVVVGGLVALVLLVAGLAAVVGRSSGRDRSNEPAYGTMALTAAPATGLRDSTLVELRATGFEADTVVQVLLCAVPEGTHRVVTGDCDSEAAVRYAVPRTGPFVARHRVARAVDHDDGRTDCADDGWSCRLVAVGDAADDRRSGSVAVAFDGPEAPSDPTAAPTPAVAVAPDRVDGRAEVQVTATGFRTGEPLIVARCVEVDSYEQAEASLGDLSLYERCQPIEEEAAISAILEGDLSGLSVRADGRGRAAFTLDLTTSVDPYGSVMDRSRRLDADDLDDALHPTSPEARRVLAFDTEDCTAAPGRCTVVVAAAVEFERAAEHGYTITER